MGVKVTRGQIDGFSYGLLPLGSFLSGTLGSGLRLWPLTQHCHLTDKEKGPQGEVIRV
jgi:hypothetical protein